MDAPSPSSQEKLSKIVNSRSAGRFGDLRKIGTKITQSLTIHIDKNMMQLSTTNLLSDEAWMKILENVFKYIDFRTLQDFRYVNSVWDSAACVQLKQRAIVNLVPKTEEQIQEFAFLLQSIHQRNKSCPFQLYSLRIKMNYDQFLDVVLKDPETFIVRLDYALERNLKHDSLLPNYSYDLLQGNSSTLQYLKLSMQAHGTARNHSHTQIFPLYLPHLRDFEFLNISPANTHIPLSFLLFPYQILLGATNLQRFYSSSADHKLLNKIFEQNILWNLLDLHIADFPLQSAKFLSKAYFKKVRSIGIQRYMSVADQPGLSFENLKDLFKNVGKSVEEVAISGITNIHDKVFPPNGCTKLHTMLLDDWYGNLNVFSSEKLPHLSTIIVSNYHGSVPIYSKIQAKPHTSIERFTFKGHVDFANKMVLPEIKTEYSRMITYIRRQFPYISSFHLKMAELTVYIVRNVIEALPRLEELSLSSSVGVAQGFVVSIVLGMTDYAARQYLHHHSDITKATGRQICLLDLPELKKLTIRLFDRRDNIPLLTIKHGISKIVHLKSFAFNFTVHTNRDIRTIHEYLRHLNELIIYYIGREYWFGKNFAELKQFVEDSNLLGENPPITIITDQDVESLFSYRDKFNTVNYQFTAFVPKDSLPSLQAQSSGAGKSK